MDAAWATPFVVWPGRGSTVSAATWLREVSELARAGAHPPPFPADAKRGHGEPVIVVPAFCAPDASTAPLRRFLARQGFAAECSGCGLNLGPTKKALARLDAAVREGAERLGRKVSLIGISLGGTLAREAAKHCPGHVARVVTVVSPVNLPVATPLAPLARLAAMLWDRDARRAFPHLSEAPPVPLTAIVSPIDGVVDWRACVPAPAPQVETVLIASAHMTIGSHPDVLRVIAARLAEV